MLNVETRIRRLTRWLERRCPGVFVKVSFDDYCDFKGWHMYFRSPDPNLLVRFGIAAALSDFDSTGQVSELPGCTWSGHGIIDATKGYAISFHIRDQDGEGRTARIESGLTKKMQTQVMGLLKPFVKGTWKPREGA
jgi:hypothetical protein